MAGPLIVTGAGVVTVTFVGAEVALQPAPSVTVTLYAPALLTVMLCVVAPVDQSHDAPALAVRVTLPPVQKDVGPDGVMVGVAGVRTFTATGDDVALQPPPVVTVTVRFSFVDTVTDCVVAPFDQA